MQGRGTLNGKYASQLVDSTDTGSFIWKLPILAAQKRKHRAAPAAGILQALKLAPRAV